MTPHRFGSFASLALLCLTFLSSPGGAVTLDDHASSALASFDAADALVPFDLAPAIDADAILAAFLDTDAVATAPDAREVTVRTATALSRIHRASATLLPRLVPPLAESVSHDYTLADYESLNHIGPALFDAKKASFDLPKPNVQTLGQHGWGSNGYQTNTFDSMQRRTQRTSATLAVRRSSARAS